MSDTGGTRRRCEDANLIAFGEGFVAIGCLRNCHERARCVEANGDFHTSGFASVVLGNLTGYTAYNRTDNAQCDTAKTTAMTSAQNCAKGGAGERSHAITTGRCGLYAHVTD